MAEILALEMKEISKSFGGVKALKKVNFNAYKGKVKTKGGQFESDCLSDSSRRSCYDRFTFHLYFRMLCFQD